LREIIQPVKEIKTELMKAIKYKDNLSIAVRIYDSTELGERTCDIEITYFVDGEYVDCYVSDIFYDKEEKDALKRAKAVLKSVKGWFIRHDDIQIQNEIQIYSL
jgi:hypothetical protein